MFEVLLVSFHAVFWSIDCLVDDMLLQISACNSQLLLQISNIEYLPTVDMLLHDTPISIVNWTRVEDHSVATGLGQ